MTLDRLGLPPLDCHAHVAPDVTRTQLSGLGRAHIFAVTRNLSEGAVVADRGDRNLTWGLGMHPAVPAFRATYDPDVFRRLLPRFALVGEVGMDRRGPRDEQEHILADILQACLDRPMLISIHSAGRTPEVVDLLQRYLHPGVILHWFLGSSDRIRSAVALGAYFSVNNAMSDEIISEMPRDRILTETDFPARQVRAKQPGDTGAIEARLARAWRTSQEDARFQVWTNLKQIAINSGAIETLADPIADTLLSL